MKKLILLSIALLLFASAAFAQGSIAGTVTDAKGNAIANATVKAYGPEGPDKKVVSVTTNENGEYTFEGLAAGKYALSVIAEGFDVLIKRDITVSDENDTPAVDFALSPNPQAIAIAAQPPARAVPTMGSSGRFIRIINDLGWPTQVTWDVVGGSAGQWQSPGYPAVFDTKSPIDVTIPLPPNATNLRLQASTLLDTYDRVLPLEKQNMCHRAVPGENFMPDTLFDNGCTHLDLKGMRKGMFDAWFFLANKEKPGHIFEQMSWVGLVFHGFEIDWHQEMQIFVPATVCTKDNIGTGRFGNMACAPNRNEGIPLGNSSAYRCEKVFGAGNCTEVYNNPGMNDSGNPANGVRGYIGRCEPGYYILHKFNSLPGSGGAFSTGNYYYCAIPKWTDK